MSSSKEPTIAEVFRQVTEILQKTLSRISEVEQHVTKDLESIRRQLDAVGVLKDNIANLNNRIDLLSKKLGEISKQEPHELSRLMLRAISEFDKRMQLFTLTEVLARLESGTLTAIPSLPVRVETPTPTATAPTKATPPVTATPAVEAKAAASESIDAVGEAAGANQPWRERMREKYGLKKKPGSLLGSD